MMMKITKPFQRAFGILTLLTTLGHVAPAFANEVKIEIGDTAPKLTQDLFEKGSYLKLPMLLADTHPPIDPNVRKRFFCKKINQPSVVWNDDATQATLSTRDVLPPSDWTEWGDPNMSTKQDTYRRKCRAANPYDKRGKLTGPPNFFHIQTETWHN